MSALAVPATPELEPILHRNSGEDRYQRLVIGSMQTSWSGRNGWTAPCLRSGFIRSFATRYTTDDQKIPLPVEQARTAAPLLAE